MIFRYRDQIKISISLQLYDEFLLWRDDLAHGISNTCTCLHLKTVLAEVVKKKKKKSKSKWVPISSFGYPIISKAFSPERLMVFLPWYAGKRKNYLSRLIHHPFLLLNFFPLGSSLRVKFNSTKMSEYKLFFFDHNNL